MNALGEVVETGPEVRDFKPGDLAIPMVRRPCDHPRMYRLPLRAGRISAIPAITASAAS